jgi:hypothetical protein
VAAIVEQNDFQLLVLGDTLKLLQKEIVVSSLPSASPPVWAAALAPGPE